MNKHFLKTALLSLSIATIAQSGHSAGLATSTKEHSTKSSVARSHNPDKLSLIEKALIQQKRADNQEMTSTDELKVMAAIRVEPTQNFFATQHQRFSRFVQALFQNHES